MTAQDQPAPLKCDVRNFDFDKSKDLLRTGADQV
jgi:hypothetical protein